MDLAWNDERMRQFVTNVGLITSTGPHGQNVMAAEWTHHISYAPGLIMVCIRSGDATHDNVKETKEFGVNLCSVEQNVMSSVAGGETGKEVDKIGVLKELGFRFYPGRKIKPLMIEGTAMNAECTLKEAREIGDHTAFVGEVVEISADLNKKPLAYHQGKYWHVGENIIKPSQEERDKIQKIIEKFRK